MSKKIFYIYNPKTLTYERVYPSLRQRIIVVLRHLFVGSILSIGVIVAFYFWFGSPKEELLKMENEQMQTQYKVLSKRARAARRIGPDFHRMSDDFKSYRKCSGNGWTAELRLFFENEEKRDVS